jgi:hypothetical protein
MIEDCGYIAEDEDDERGRWGAPLRPVGAVLSPDAQA